MNNNKINNKKINNKKTNKNTTIVFHSNKSRKLFKKIIKNKIKYNKLINNFLTEAINVLEDFPSGDAFIIMNSILRNNPDYDKAMESFIVENPDFDFENLDIIKVKNLKKNIRNQLKYLVKKYNSARNINKLKKDKSNDDKNKIIELK